MKPLIIVSLLFCATTAHAKNYYISSLGNDANNGLTPSAPWKTIAKLNTSFGIIAAGDSILFKRDETFYGTITITKSGTSGNPITIGAYGTGAKSIITGFTTIGGWTNQGGGIYSKVITSSALTNMVTIDGVQYGMGRYPDTAWLSYESFSTNISITDKGLGTSTNWKGAEAVIRKNDWTIDRNIISAHTGDVLTFTSLGYTADGTNGYGYFFQNDIRCVTSYGEWYHNTTTGKFYMYFGATDPTTKVVKVATANNNLYNNGFDNITVENINFQGSITDAVLYSGTTNSMSIQNCDIRYAGNAGIYIGGGAGNVNNNTVQNCNRTGISTDGTTTITKNIIRDIAVITGQYLSSGGVASGMYIAGNNSIAQYNTIINTGYNGVTLKSVGASTVQYNFIDSACTVLDDGGGIYASGNNASVRLIDHNIITNVIGNNSGTDNTTLVSAGIYLDESASKVTVSNNTVANITSSGIKIHKSNNNVINYNTSFNTLNGLFFQNNVGTSYIFKNTIIGNILCASKTTQYTLKLSSNVNDLSSFGTFDSNYYARPMNDSLSISTFQPSTGDLDKTVAQWKTFSNQDAHCKTSPKAISDESELKFQYNSTNLAKTITLDAKYIDITNTIYNGTITLQPYSSTVLIKLGPITSTFKADAGTDISLIMPINNTILKGSAIGTITNYSWTKISGPAQFIIANPNNPSTAISNLAMGKYTFQLKVINSAGDSAIATVNVVTLGVLPVTLIDFSAKNNNNKIVLDWKVASEINVSHYAVERSGNSQTFENIGQVDAANLFTIQGNYNYEDNFPLQGDNYYRLVMVDKDGTIKFSKIISITKKSVASFKLNTFSLSANNNNLKISINSNYQQIMQVVLADVSGRILYSNPIQLQKGFNTIDKKIPALNTGVYYAKLFTKDQIITKSLLSKQ